MAPDATPSHGALSLADTVLVSNRGPLAFHEENGQPVPGTVGGGLAGSLHPLVVDTGATWVACALSGADRAAAAAGLMTDDGLAIELVDPDPDRYSMAYNVISNATLWYCHHHLFDAARRPRADRRWWEAWDAYRELNNQFAHTVAKVAPGRWSGVGAGLPPRSDRDRTSPPSTGPAHGVLHSHTVRRPLHPAHAADHR